MEVRAYWTRDKAGELGVNGVCRLRYCTCFFAYLLVSIFSAYLYYHSLCMYISCIFLLSVLLWMATTVYFWIFVLSLVHPLIMTSPVLHQTRGVTESIRVDKFLLTWYSCRLYVWWTILSESRYQYR